MGERLFSADDGLAASGQGKRPLRFAVMCSSMTLQGWQAKAIRRLTQHGVAEPVLVIRDTTPTPDRQTNSARKLIARFSQGNVAWRLFQHLSRPRAHRSASVSDLLGSLPSLECHTLRKGRFSQFFSDKDVADIWSHDLDFILRFGFGIIRGAILDAARYGVWSFHHGDELRYRGGPPCFWEIYYGDPVTGAILQRLTDKLDSGIVLRKGYLKTVNYSYARAVDQLFFESASWPAYVATEIQNGIYEHNALPSSTDAPIFRTPSDATVVKFVGILVRNAFRRILERLQSEEWNVGVASIQAEGVLSGRPVRHVRWMPAIPGGWLADPIAVAEDGQLHVLCERMNNAIKKAHICSATFDGAHWTAPLTAIDTGTHASYPYILRHRASIYCIPETFEANEVRLYRAIDFPRSWELVATLLEGIAALDSTVFEHDGRLWLFCTTRQASATRLYAYYADELLGPWRPHLRNPVKIDVRGSRPAGPPIVYNGILYRPAQDSSRTYGGRVVIHRVLALTPTTFREEPETYVEPDPDGPYNQALHTISFAGNYCVIDGKRWRLG